MGRCTQQSMSDIHVPLCRIRLQNTLNQLRPTDMKFSLLLYRAAARPDFDVRPEIPQILWTSITYRFKSSGLDTKA